MRLNNIIKHFSFIGLSFLGACTNVEPYERGDLAASHMLLVTDPLQNAFREHVYASREGTSGGFGIEAGGCGCN